MAISTATDIITEVQGFYRAIDSTTVQSYLSIVMDELCMKFPIAIDKMSLRLTAETGEYAFAVGNPWYAYQTNTALTVTSASLVRIESAYYVDTDEVATMLTPTVAQELDQTISTSNWRYADSGTPKYIYTAPNSTGGYSLGLYPKPDTSSATVSVNSVTMYEPRVDFVYRKKIGSSFTGTTTVPSSITDPDVLIQGVLSHIYRRENNGQDSGYYQAYIKCQGNLADELARRHREYRPNLVNNISTPRGV